MGVSRRGVMVATMAAPAVAQPAARPLRFVPQANLASIDPVWSTAVVVRNHGLMIYDLLYGLDAQYRAQPQMAAGHEISADGLTWAITLREGLRFHDNEPVRARDAVASIIRWSKRDVLGQRLDRLADEIAAADDRTIRIRLKRPWPGLAWALGKPSANICAIMPERVARTDPFQQISDATGSGPFRFRADLFRPGDTAVYEKFVGYTPRAIWFLDETDVNLRMHDRGWRFAVAEDAEIHHKYEAGVTRTRSAVPRTMYPQLRSKAYFCVRHNLGRRRFTEVFAYLADYIAKERAWKRGLLNQGADEATVARLIDEVERGVEDGVAAALRLTATPTLLSAATLARARGDVFQPFPLRLGADQRLRVCLFSREYPPQGHGGIGQWTREVAVGLAARGHEVTVIARALDGPPRIDFVDGVWVHRVDAAPISQAEAAAFAPAPASLTSYSLALYQEYARIDARRRFDLISGPIADLEPMVCLARAQAPVIVSLHTTYRLSLPYKPDWLSRPDYLANHVEPTIVAEGHLMTKGPHILANSRTIVADVEAAHGLKIDRARIDIVPHGISDLSLAVEPRAADGGVHLLFVGRLEERKGADALLTILPGLLAAHSTLIAHIVGDDGIVVGETTLRRKFEADNAARPDIVARARFYGALPRDAVLARYAACDIFVAPSKYESFGLIFIEAMCFGKPAVAYNVGGAAELIRDGVDGLLAPAGEPEKLADCIARLVEDRALREAIGARARRTYEAEFTTALMIDRLEAYYISVIRQHGGETALPPARRWSA